MLTDPVASHILGELHDLTKKIDGQIATLETTAKLVDGAAENITQKVRDALKETKTDMAKVMAGSSLDDRFADHMKELNRIAAQITKAREQIPEEVKAITRLARGVALNTLDDAKNDITKQVTELAKQVVDGAVAAANAKYKAELRLISAGIASVAVVVALVGAMAGYAMGKNVGYAEKRVEISTATKTNK